MLRVLAVVVAAAVAVCRGDLVAVNFNCDTMIPLGFETMAPRQDSNFRILLSPMANFVAGEPITVTYETKQEAFNSFMVQARKVGGTEPLGSWDTEGSPFYRTFSCSSSEEARPQNTIMVAAREVGRAAPEFDRIELTWTPPAGAGMVEFIATFVQEEEDASVNSFWLEVTSSIMTETHGEL